MAKATGRVIQIQGSVVDVEFPEGELPNFLKRSKSSAKGGTAGAGSGKAPGQWTGCAVSRWIPPMACSVVLPAAPPAPRSWCRWDLPPWGASSMSWVCRWMKRVRSRPRVLPHSSPGAALRRTIHPHRDFRNRHQGHRPDRALHQGRQDRHLRRRGRGQDHRHPGTHPLGCHGAPGQLGLCRGGRTHP